MFAIAALRRAARNANVVAVGFHGCVGGVDQGAGASRPLFFPPVFTVARNGHGVCVEHDAMDRELRITVLRRAVDISGGASALQQRLRVEQHSLELWLSGRATVPEWVFVQAVDLVVRDDIARAAQDRRGSPRAQDGKNDQKIARSS